ncbi:cation transporter HKT2;1 [Elaeis guineensis]|uniref:Cation transporter HKT1 n=1 Tax=Elaeis guineensis var. tenera TaxID=51953 RepID=A0A6I9RNV8_ELAGV|nr:cation transporter HKT1 [Elaeis guineensis]
MAAISLTQLLQNFANGFAHIFARVSGHMHKKMALVSRYGHKIIVFHLSPFWIQLSYFVSLAMLGSLIMMKLKPSNPAFSPSYVDMLFMSTSAVTLASLGSVEMENFSSSQIVVLTLLMFLGGEIFVSLIGLLLRIKDDGYGGINPDTAHNRVDPVVPELNPMDPSNAIDCVEVGPTIICSETSLSDGKDLRLRSVRYLGHVLWFYLLLIHVTGSLSILSYIASVTSAWDVLKRKGINVFLFSLSTTVSSFANAGFIPTNENMAIFKVNPGLLLLIIPQILAGNTLFPLFLRLVIWALRRCTGAAEFEYLLKNYSREIGFRHLLPNLLRTAFLSLTVLSFTATMVVLFCSLDWNSSVFDGLNSYQKIINALFMAVNTRHAGENSIDVSLVSPAVLVFFIVMMYLPSSTTFLPVQEDDTSSAGNKKNNRRRRLVDNIILSPLSYIVIFIIAICIIERRNLSSDPLNFSALNITFEVMSAYGTVGLSTGYSCARLLQLHPDVKCQDKLYSFVGAWSDEGKLILAFVMLYGRLKKFSLKGGKAWRII